MFHLGVLAAMAHKLNFVMKSPKQVMKSSVAKAKAKGKAKAKASPKKKTGDERKIKKESAKTPEKKTPETTEVAEVSRLNQQHFNTFLTGSDDPRAESIRAIYHGMAGNDPKKKELAAQWKLDKSLSCHVHHEEVHSSGKSQEQSQTVGWMQRWILFWIYSCFEIFLGGRTPCRIDIQYHMGSIFRKEIA